MSDEFYIGYQKQAPPMIARRVAYAAAAILTVVTSVAIALGAGQRAAGDGNYQFGTVESFEGMLNSLPVPHLKIAAAGGGTRHALLVAKGKHGIPPYVREALGSPVRLSATRIERHGFLMLELAGPDQFEVLDDTPAGDESLPAGETLTINGELVDTKCYLGVMNPGQGKVHRGCAAECLRGGIPPGLLVHGANGTTTVIFIAADSGVINPEWAGRRLTLTGTIRKTGELETIHADTARLVP